jgi:hypothetical protein
MWRISQKTCRWNINISINNCNNTKIFLRFIITIIWKLCYSRSLCFFGALSFGIGIYLCFQDQNVNIITTGKNMIQDTIINIVRTSITTNNLEIFLSKKHQYDSSITWCLPMKLEWYLTIVWFDQKSLNFQLIIIQVVKKFLE